MNLYILHVIGMDLIHGSWAALLNLHLLAIGLDIRFIGLRPIVDGVGRAITVVPARLDSDRIGRKASFILGDPMGAVPGLLPAALGGPVGAAGGYFLRGKDTIFRTSAPLDDASDMDVLDARERATSTGLGITVGGALSAAAMHIGSRLMATGDFTTAFLINVACYLVSTVTYWRVFRPLEISELAAREQEQLPVAHAVRRRPPPAARPLPAALLYAPSLASARRRARTPLTTASALATTATSWTRTMWAPRRAARVLKASVASRMPPAR